MIFRRRDRSLIGKTQRHYLPSQQRHHNHQWSMVINRCVNDDVEGSVKPINLRYHSNTCSSSVPPAKSLKEHQVGLHQQSGGDDDWKAAGRRLLLSADDSSNSPPPVRSQRPNTRAIG